jgi:hypothetical protein
MKKKSRLKIHFAVNHVGVGVFPACGARPNGKALLHNRLKYITCKRCIRMHEAWLKTQ